jgi:hypothetical protein
MVGSTALGSVDGATALGSMDGVTALGSRDGAKLGSVDFAGSMDGTTALGSMDGVAAVGTTWRKALSSRFDGWLNSAGFDGRHSGVHKRGGTKDKNRAPV